MKDIKILLDSQDVLDDGYKLTITFSESVDISNDGLELFAEVEITNIINFSS